MLTRKRGKHHREVVAPEGYLTLHQVAEVTHRHYETVRTWVLSGKLASCRDGKSPYRFVRVVDLIAYLGPEMAHSYGLTPY